MPTREQLAAADEAADTVDWKRLASMTDEEILAEWACDPDMTWPTEDELAAFELVRSDAGSRRLSEPAK